jgi:hypothetical protein
MRVDLDHEGLVGVVEHRDVLVVVLLRALHEGDGRLTGESGGRGED